MDWSKLEPDTVVVAGTAVLGALGWLWQRAKGDVTATARKLLDDVIAHAVAYLLTEPFPLKAARTVIANECNAALAGLNVPANVRAALVRIAVEQGYALLMRKLSEQALRDHMSGAAAGAARVVEAMKPKGEIPALSDVMTVEETARPIPSLPKKP